MDTDKNLLHDLSLRYSHKCSWYLRIMKRELVATLVLLVLTARVLVRVCPTWCLTANSIINWSINHLSHKINLKYNALAKPGHARKLRIFPPIRAYFGEQVLPLWPISTNLTCKLKW